MTQLPAETGPSAAMKSSWQADDPLRWLDEEEHGRAVPHSRAHEEEAEHQNNNAATPVGAIRGQQSPHRSGATTMHTRGRSTSSPNALKDVSSPKSGGLPVWFLALVSTMTVLLFFVLAYLTLQVRSMPASTLTSLGKLDSGGSKKTGSLSVDPPHRYFFAFGASYTTVGFNINSTWPSAANPIGNPAYPGKTEAKGANWVDYLTMTYNTSLTYTFDFAESGAVTDKKVVGVQGSVRSFKQQVEDEWLPNLGHRPMEAPWDPKTAGFGVFVGINDIVYTFQKLDVDKRPRAKEYVAGYYKILETLYKSGARNFFIFNINPIQDSPMISPQKKEFVQSCTEWVSIYNNELSIQGDTFRKSHSDAKLLVFDNHAIWSKVLANPKKYCFKDASSIGDGGCPNIWANNFHPGYEMQRIVTKQLAQDLKDTGIFLTN